MTKKILIRPTEGVPVKSWCREPEEGALKQADNLALLPFVFKHIALMPDTHQGYGMPIGGVMAARDVIVPNAVGVDIGCGMLAAKTSLKVQDLTIEQLKAIMGGIRRRVPVGFSRHAEPRPVDAMPPLPTNAPVCVHQFDRARRQVGTLGGGNHFIEIQKDAEDNIWIMIHSGSRNLGKQVCDLYNKLAAEENARWHSAVDPKWQLAFLPLFSELGQRYFNEMCYCLEFSKANRREMLTSIEAAFREVLPTQLAIPLDIQHNYAAMEHHFGENVLVHRKGATRARAEQQGIIPGSQGTASYIVEGLGNPDSFMSCSHGAGRRMGRKEAQRSLNLKEEIQRMDNAGILHGIRGQDDLDEAAGAYKDIDTVMAEQQDLVKILVKLTPIAVVKG